MELIYVQQKSVLQTNKSSVSVIFYYPHYAFNMNKSGQDKSLGGPDHWTFKLCRSLEKKRKKKQIPKNESKLKISYQSLFTFFDENPIVCEELGIALWILPRLVEEEADHPVLNDGAKPPDESRILEQFPAQVEWNVLAIHNTW